VLVLVFFFLPSLFADFGTFLSSVPTYLESLNRWGILDQYAQVLGVEQPVLSSSADVLIAAREALNLDAFGSASSVIAFVFGGIFSSVLIIVLSFYFAVVETGVDDFLRVVTPKKRQHYVLGLWRRSQHKIGLWMQGQLLLGVLIGVLTYLGLMILSVPHALVLAVIAGLLELIPVFGPPLSAVPAVAVAFVTGGPTLGLLTVALYVIIQQFENHLIYPLVVTRVVGVPPILVIVTLIAGGQLAGFLGILLSVPVAAVIQELVNDLESGRLVEEVKG
jgi:predicted PurR-regulated permease PerM